MALQLFGSARYGYLFGPSNYNSFQKEIQPFPLNRLPILVRIEIIRSLEYKECLNLAMASERSAKTVKSARLKANFLNIHISSMAYLLIQSWKLKMFYGQKWKSENDEVMMRPDEMNPWLNEQSESIVENAVKLYKKIDDLFVFDFKFALVFKDDYEQHATVKEVLSNPTLKDWQFCYFYGEKIDANDLKVILDMATTQRVFGCYVEEIPDDFRHEKAFTFFDIVYHDARWVQIEDLYSVRNCKNVTLGRTNFTHKQIKDYFRFWVNSEVDTFDWMKITTSEAIDFNDFFDGLVVIHYEDGDASIVFTLSKSSFDQKKQKLFSIDHYHGTLILSYWREDKKFAAREDEDEKTIAKFQNCHEILKVLHKKKKLEEQLTMSENKERPGLLREINYVVDKLASFNVSFEDGKAILS